MRRRATRVIAPRHWQPAAATGSMGGIATLPTLPPAIAVVHGRGPRDVIRPHGATAMPALLRS